MRFETSDSAEQTAFLEDELVRQARDGDERAFREIVERYQDSVLALTAAIVGSAGAADDVAQGVFAKLHRSLSCGAPRPSLATWVYRTGVSESFDYFRKHQGSGRAGGTEDRRVAVVRLLATLPVAERDLLILKEVQGRSVEELARLTNSDIETVGAALFRARQKLLKAAKDAVALHMPPDGPSTTRRSVERGGLGHVR